MSIATGIALCSAFAGYCGLIASAHLAALLLGDDLWNIGAAVGGALCCAVNSWLAWDLYQEAMHQQAIEAERDASRRAWAGVSFEGEPAHLTVTNCTCFASGNECGFATFWYSPQIGPGPDNCNGNIVFGNEGAGVPSDPLALEPRHNLTLAELVQALGGDGASEGRARFTPEGGLRN